MHALKSEMYGMCEVLRLGTAKTIILVTVQLLSANKMNSHIISREVQGYLDNCMNVRSIEARDSDHAFTGALSASDSTS